MIFMFSLAIPGSILAAAKQQNLHPFSFFILLLTRRRPQLSTRLAPRGGPCLNFGFFDLVGELDVKTDHLGFMHDERKTARLTVAMLMIDGGRTNLDVIFGTREQATAHFDQTETQMIMTYPPHFPIRLRLQTLPCFGLNFSLLPAFI